MPGNGGEMHDITVEILRGIRSDLATLNQKVEALVEGQQVLVEGQQALIEGHNALVEGQKALVEGQRVIISRLENIRDFAGEHYRTLEQRVSAIEERLDRR